MSIYMAKAFLAVARFFAGLRSGKPKYTISENGIAMTFERMVDREETPYDFETHEDCQVFIKGYANPVKLEPKANGEYDLMPSSKYRLFMKQNVLKQAFFAQELDMRKILYAVGANILISAFVGVVIVSLIA